MTGPDTKLSAIGITTDITGGYFHIILPDGLGNFISYRIAFSTIAGYFMQSSTYDPTNVASDVFDSLNIRYDNTDSGLTEETVKEAIDELAGLIEEISTVFDYIDITPTITAPTYKEGRIWYDAAKKAIAYFTDDEELQLNPGREIAFYVLNTSGSDIPNGTAVCPFGDDIGLADNRYKDRSRPVAVATTTIENGTYGNITKLGQVTMDTTAWAVNDRLYLGTNGQMTTILPTDGSYVVLIGIVDVIGDETSGLITVDIQTTNLTVETTDNNGFPPDERDSTDLSFVDATRTFTITPNDTDYHYYIEGEKYEKESSDDVVIPDTTGDHIIYFDGETLLVLTNGSSAEIAELILHKCTVAYIYWNADTALAELIVDERHGMSMSPVTHLYLHRTRGAQYISGLSPNNLIIGDGSLNSHAQFGVLTGIIVDEDLEHILNTIASTTGLKYYYRFGSNGYWRASTNAGYSFPVGATPLPQYNQYTGSTWQLTEVTSNYFMLIHLLAVGAINNNPVVFLGINQYSSAALATTGASTELGQLLGNLPSPEFVPIATLILECKTSFTNSVNAKYSLTGDGNNYIDWRVTEISRGSTPSNHNNLSGLQEADIGVTWGHISDQSQDIYGLKNFNDGISITSKKQNIIIEDTIPNSSTNYYVAVGDVTLHNVIKIEYVATRDTLTEKGSLLLSNKAGTDSNRIAELDDVGIDILKSISGNSIRIDVTDNTGDGNDIDLVLDTTLYLL